MLFSFREEKEACQTRGLLVSSVCQCDANELFFVEYSVLSNRHCSGLRIYINWDKNFPKELLLLRKYVYCAFMLYMNLSLVQKRKVPWNLAIICYVIIIEAIYVIGNVIFCFSDSLVLLSFRLHMPEKHFLVLMSPSTRQLLKSASSIKQPTYLYPICQWKLPCLRKMDGLRITFHRPLSCPHIT